MPFPKKIKVLRIIARLNIGGPAIHTVLLTQGLNKNKFDSSLLCGSISESEGDMSYYARQKDVLPVYIPWLKRELNFINDLRAFIEIYKIISKVKPDIIHTHTAKAGTLGRLAGLIYNLNSFNPKRILLFHTFHGHVFEGYFGKIRSKVFIFIERILGIFTTRIITVSELVKKELLSLGIASDEKVKVIPLGLELDRFMFMDSRDEPVINIGIVGRLVPVKNHQLFLEAASLLVKKFSEGEIKLKIIGDGELRKELEDYSLELGLSKLVEFLGWQFDPAQIYSDLDIVVLTSLNEGTPVSLIEAMACARVIIATEAGGVRDLLGNPRKDYSALGTNFKILERGLIVNSFISKDLKDAIEFIIQHPVLRKDIGISGRQFVKEKFSKERLIKDIENLYLAEFSS